jgi:phosphate starvation-inducible membrane PsiE
MAAEVGRASSEAALVKKYKTPGSLLDLFFFLTMSTLLVSFPISDFRFPFREMRVLSIA